MKIFALEKYESAEDAQDDLANATKGFVDLSGLDKMDDGNKMPNLDGHQENNSSAGQYSDGASGKAVASINGMVEELYNRYNNSYSQDVKTCHDEAIKIFSN